MGEGAETMIFMGVVLKIPVAALLYIVWRAVTDAPAPEQAPPGDDEHQPRRFRRSPNRPRGPRRGPHPVAPGGAAVSGSGSRPRRGAQSLRPRRPAPGRQRTA